MWSWTSETVPVLAISGPDDESKTDLFVDAAAPATQAAWWQDYAYALRMEFARRALQYSLNVTNVQVTAVGLDVRGIGQLTVTFTTS